MIKFNKDLRLKKAMALLLAVLMIFATLPSAMFADTYSICNTGVYVSEQTKDAHAQWQDFYDDKIHAGAQAKAGVSATNASARKPADGKVYKSWFAQLEKWAEYTNANNEFDVTLQVTGNKIIPPPAPTVNVLVLDYSASMLYSLDGKAGAKEKGQRFTAMKDSVDAFLNKMTDQDYVAIVRYGTRASIKADFTQTTTSGIKSLKNAINSNPPTNNDYTNIQGGLAGAIQLLNEPLTTGDLPATVLRNQDTDYNAVLMSDGGANSYYIDSSGGENQNYTSLNLDRSSYYSKTAAKTAAENAAKYLKNTLKVGAGEAVDNRTDKSIRVFSIGLGTAGTDFDEGLMKKIASPVANSQTATYFFKAANKDDFVKEFEKIAGLLHPSVEEGIITDVIPADFQVVEVEGKVARVGGGAVTGLSDYQPTIEKNNNPDGTTTITWSNVPSLGENQSAYLVIRVKAPETCDSNTNHLSEATNVRAELRYTNLTNKSGEYTAEFPIPKVHVPVMHEGDVSIVKSVAPYTPGTSIPDSFRNDNTLRADCNTSVIYKIVITNTYDEAKEVTLSDKFENETVAISSLFQALDDQYQPIPLTSNKLTVPAGKSVAVYYIRTLASGDTEPLTNLAEITFTNGDGDKESRNDSEDVTINQPGISVEKTVLQPTDKAVLGDLIIFMVTVENTGDVALSNVTFDDKLSGIKGPFSSEEEARNGEQTVVSNGYSLGVNDTMSRYYTYKVDVTDITKDNIVNNVTVTGKANGKTVSDDDDASKDLAHPILSVHKEVVTDPVGYDGDDPVYNDGSTLMFKITVKNDGDGVAKNVKLTDIWDEEFGTLTLIPNEDELDPDSFEVGPNEEVEFFYSVVLKGQNLEEAKEVFESAKETALGAIDAANTLIQDLNNALVIEQEELDNLKASFEAALNGEPVGGSEDEPTADPEEESVEDPGEDLGEDAGEGSEDESIPDAEEAPVNTLSEADIAEYEARIAEAQADVDLILYGTLDDSGERYLKGSLPYANQLLEEAKAQLDTLINNGLGKILVRVATNEATYDSDYGSSSSSVTVKINPQSVTAVSMKKQVRISGEDDNAWRDVARFPTSAGGDVEFRIAIANKGTEEVTVNLNDTFEGESSDRVDVIGPESTQYVYLSENDFSENDIVTENLSYTSSEVYVNKATVSFMENDQPVELTDYAYVIVPPRDYAQLNIDKKVLAGDAWLDSHTIYSDETDNTFTYRVTVWNYGTADAVFNLTDNQLPAEVQVYGAYDSATQEFSQPYADLSDLSIAAGEKMEFFYQLTVTTANAWFNNVAGFTIVGDTPLKEGDDGTGEDEAAVKVSPYLKVSLVLSKQVILAANYNGAEATDGWEDSINMTVSDNRVAFYYRITIENTSDPDGDGATAQIKLADVLNGIDMLDGNERAELGIDLDSLPAGLEALAGTISLAPGTSQSFDIPVVLESPTEVGQTSEYVNTVTLSREDVSVDNVNTVIEITNEGEEGSVSDDAEVILEKTDQSIIQLSINKQVAIAGNVTDPTTIAESSWKKEISESTRNTLDVFYRITVTKSGTSGYGVNGMITDEIEKSDIIVNLFSDNNLDGDDNANTFLIPAEGAGTYVAYAKVTLPEGPATYTNVATIIEYTTDREPDPGSEPEINVQDPKSEADVVITEPSGGGDDPRTGPPVDDDPTPIDDDPIPQTPPVIDNPIIIEDQIPLALPEEIEEIEETEETEAPLGVPKAGADPSSATALGSFLIALTGMVLRKKNK